MSLIKSIFGSASSAGGQSGGGVGLGVKGLQDPNAARSALDRASDLSEAGGYGPSMAAQPDLITVLAAPVIDTPLSPAAATPAPSDVKKPDVDESVLPSANLLSQPKTPGEVDQNGARKVEDGQRVASKLDDLKQNAQTVCKDGAEKTTPATTGTPSVTRGVAAALMPGRGDIAAIGVASVLGSPAAGAVVAAATTGFGIARALSRAATPGDSALKGQGTAATMGQQTTDWGKVYNTKNLAPVQYPPSNPVPIEKTTAPLALDAGPKEPLSGRLWQTRSLADTGIRFDDPATQRIARITKNAEDAKAYLGGVKQNVESPLDLNRDNLTRAVAAGTEIKMDDLANRRVLQFQPAAFA
ncbi:MAG: hypothetical protein H6862_01855 [Rhodospirillales bacterium]|nr:hypothetical protein [Rhodospirillales bacterium]